ncbi:restriction endonuclease subunit S [Geobacillus sp. FSL K6-3411]|uniref:restriction endonuclease subunit S n=1 Tax=Geobacillus sp. FSL K6-3411 TaxID=2954614 RepID=UPI0030DA7C2E
MNLAQIVKKRDWLLVDLPDVVFFQEGPGVRNNQYTTSGVKLLNVANLQDGRIVLDNTDRYISEDEAYGRYQHFLVDEGDLIIASSGIKVEYFDKKMGFVEKHHLPLCLNTSTIRFKSLDNSVLDIRYFMYFLKSNYFKKQLSRLITGSAQLNFGPSHLKKIKVILPDIYTQKRIVSILDKAQELIDKRKAQIEALDQLTQSVFLEMFGDPVANKTWERRPLKDITDVRDGTHDSPKYVPSGYPLVTSKNIKNGKIDLRNVNYISEEDFININKRSKVDIGDIIMPMIGTIGNPIIVDEQPNFAIKNVALIKFNNPCVINIYIKYLLNSHYLDYILNKNKRGGTQKFLSLTDIRNMEIPLPPRDLQAKFSEIVKKVDSQKAILHKSLTELENNFNSLMQRAFKGELFND